MNMGLFISVPHCLCCVTHRDTLVNNSAE